MSYYENCKYNKRALIFVGSLILGALVISFTSCSRKDVTQQGAGNIDYYTCGMHPSVKVSPEEFNRGKVDCPVCNMKLTPVYKEETSNPASPAGRQKPETRGKRDELIYYGCGVDTEGKCLHCDLGKPDEKCICGEHSFMIEGKKINCPVCGEPLKKLTQGEVDRLKGVVSKVKIKGEQIRLAGVKTERVRRLHLYKKIRTVGKVAYDPQLAITQEEFISSLKTLDKVDEGSISEIRERAVNLVESSKRKLKLLGLSEKQIKELENTRKVQKSLILPEKKMWIYGDVYEYELGWVKVGEKVKVTTGSFPGEVFDGVISSINPVVDPKTRSIRFRAEVDNPDLKLKPEMYVDVIVQSMYHGPGGGHMVLAIPKGALLDTGTRRIVWVDKGNGEYEGRIVELGPEATVIVDGKESNFYPVLKGLNKGELVVTKANFLIDSQSQITGSAASAYGGALEAEEKETHSIHQH